MPKLVYPHPRDWAADEDRNQFGKKRTIRWNPANTLTEQATLAAAQKQHNLARGIRTYRDNAGLTTTAIAQAAGMEPSTVRAILNGSRHATLAALYALASTVDANLVVQLDQR